MAIRHATRLALSLVFLAHPCLAVVIDSGPVAIAIPATADGLRLRLDSAAAGNASHFTAYASGGVLAFGVHPGATVTATGGQPATLRAGDVVGANASWLAQATLAPARVRAGGIFVVGVRFEDAATGTTNLGYVQIATTAPSGFPATVLRYAYDDAAGAIAVAGDDRVMTAAFEPQIQAASCSAADVQAALDQAPAGATVRVPAGDCDWTDRKVRHARSVVLRGAGRNATIVRRSAAIVEGGNYLLTLDCTGGERMELSDIAFVGNDAGQDAAQRRADADDGVGLVGGCIDFRVHDARFSEFSNAGLTLRGNPQRGVVYRNDFLANFKCGPDINYPCLGYGVAVYGDRTWPSGALGTREAVFVEDNYFFDNRHGVAANYGARYVARHNTFVTTERTRDYAQIDAHGRGTSAGTRSWEIYANAILTSPPEMVADGIGLRGGDGVAFGNTLRRIPYVAHLSNETCVGTYPLENQIRDAYFWNNRYTPIPGYDPTPIWIKPGCEPYLQLGRDYYTTPKPGYTAYVYPHPLR